MFRICETGVFLSPSARNLTNKNKSNKYKFREQSEQEK